jgi:hypothetical protein
MQTATPDEIKSLCERCDEAFGQTQIPDSCIELARRELRQLLLNRSLVSRLMQSIVDGGPFPDALRPTLFDNEIVLHVAPGRLYSLRMYLWGPGEYTAIHDHNAWGVIGPVTDGFEVINYSRLDDGSRDGYAELQERERFFLCAGESAHTYPLDRGIHMTGNPTLETTITLSLYGKALARPYIQGFEPVNQRVFRIMSPKRKKAYLAAEALRTLSSHA